MVDINDLNAMANVHGNIQDRLIAKEQAKRDRETQKQNSEIIALLKEQEKREAEEKKRLGSLPKCPDCKSPVEVGSRRCPKCAAEIVSWDYSGSVPWRLICRQSEAQSVITERLTSLEETCKSHKEELLESVAFFNKDWKAYSEKTVQNLGSKIARYDPKAHQTIRMLLQQLSNNESLCTPKQKKVIEQMQAKMAAECGEVEIYKELKGISEQKKGSNQSGFGCLAVLGVLSGIFISFCCFLGYYMDYTSKQEESFRAFTYSLAFLGASITLLLIHICVCAIKQSSINKRQKSVEAIQASRAVAQDAITQKGEEFNNAWKDKLSNAGITQALQVVQKQIKRSKDTVDNAKQLNGLMLQRLTALTDTLEFAGSINVASASVGHDKVAGIRKMVNALTDVDFDIFTIDDSILGKNDRIETTMQETSNFRKNLQSLPI